MASHEEGLSICDVSDLIDVSDIHPFSINSKDIVYIQTRQNNKKPESGNKKSVNKCRSCGRVFQKDKSFCSIECKLEFDKSKIESKVSVYFVLFLICCSEKYFVILFIYHMTP